MRFLRGGTQIPRSMGPLQIHHFVKKSQQSLNTMQIPEALFSPFLSGMIFGTLYTDAEERDEEGKSVPGPMFLAAAAVNLVMMEMFPFFWWNSIQIYSKCPQTIHKTTTNCPPRITRWSSSSSDVRQWSGLSSKKETFLSFQSELQEPVSRAFY